MLKKNTPNSHECFIENKIRGKTVRGGYLRTGALGRALQDDLGKGIKKKRERDLVSKMPKKKNSRQGNGCARNNLLLERQGGSVA